jgi:hypothetical protein
MPSGRHAKFDPSFYYTLMYAIGSNLAGVPRVLKTVPRRLFRVLPLRGHPPEADPLFFAG